MSMAVSLLKIFKNFENIIQLLHSWSWQMLEYGFLKMWNLRFINWFKVMWGKNPSWSMEPLFWCLWAIMHWWTASFFSLFPSRAQWKRPSSLSWPCLSHICKHYKWYLWKYKSSYSRNTSFSQWLFTWGFQWCSCCIFCAGGRLGHVTHTQNTPLPEKGRHSTVLARVPEFGLECQTPKTWIWMD